MQIYPPWGANPRLFRTFFLENPAALRLFVSSLLSIPESRILSLIPRGPAFPLEYPEVSASASGDLRSLSVSLSLTGQRPVILDLFPTELLPSSILLKHRMFLHSTVSPLSFEEAPTFPEVSFFRIFLIFQSSPAARKFPFYGELLSFSKSLSLRFLCPFQLPLASGAEQASLLAHWGRFLLLSHTRELPKFSASSPRLSCFLPPLEDCLRNRELSSLFQNRLSPLFGQDGMTAMCSLNRLLLRENRIFDLTEASRNPEALTALFREYQEKGLL